MQESTPDTPPHAAASTYLIELETHECLDQGRLAAGLVPHDEHGR